jgi:winged helix DNA-binding protein
VSVEGEQRRLLAADLEALGAAAADTATVRLLPAFDQYVVAATRHSDALSPAPVADRIYRPQGWLTPVLCVGGRFLGVWRHERQGRRVAVTIEPFAKVGKAVRAGAQD